MVAIIKRLGISEDEISKLEKKERPWKKNIKKTHVEMYHTPAPSNADIAAFEANFGALPLDYKSFLQQFNGGVPKPNTIVTKDNERVISHFFPLNHPVNFREHLLSCLQNYKTRIPRGMLPIASSGGGDLILVQIQPADACYGKIYYWSHELESESDASDYYDNIELIADSFGELLNKLQEVE